MNLYEEIKNIFKDSKFSVIDFSYYVEYQIEKLKIHLFVLESLDYIELEINMTELKTKEDLNNRIKMLVNF